MILFTLVAAFFLGLLRSRVWVVPLLVIAAVILQLGVASGGNFRIWEPLNNPIFVDLVLKMLLANFVACVVGYTVGRLIAFAMGYLGRNFRTPLD
jgi:hypothetical protein